MPVLRAVSVCWLHGWRLADGWEGGWERRLREALSHRPHEPHSVRVVVLEDVDTWGMTGEREEELVRAVQRAPAGVCVVATRQSATAAAKTAAWAGNAEFTAASICSAVST